MVSAFFEKKRFFLNSALMDFLGGPGRVPRRVLGAQVASQEPLGFLGRAPATSQGALGKVGQVHWGLFGGVLDLQKYVRAQIMVKHC